MKCYTIQKLKTWEEAQVKGYLTGNEEVIDEDFLPSYKWMINQMEKRIENYNNEFPIWLWLDTSNISFVELLEDEWVLLEAELNENEVLISHFDAWHYVLNNSSFEEEDNSITKEESWEYIFDKDKLKKFDYDFEKGDLQVTVGKINCKDIKVKKYILNNKL